MQDVIVASGPMFEVGRQIGRRTKEEIAFVEQRLVPDLCSTTFGGNVRQFRKAIADYRRQAEEFFAPAMEFAAGMAAGAGMAIDDLLAVTFCEELSLGSPAERCSTLVVRGKNGWIIGHQEDYAPEFYGRMLIYDLRIDGWPRTFSLNYAGNLPHLAGSLNEEGLAITNNSLWLAVRPGLPKQVKHFRAAMQGTLTEAISDLAAQPCALTDHFTVASAPEDSVISLEVSHPDNAEKPVAMRRVVTKPESGSHVIAPFAHANHLRWINPRDPDPAPAGSHMRYWRLEAIAKEEAPASVEEMCAVLSTRDGIIRRDEELNWTLQPNSVTLATIVIDPSARRISFLRYTDEAIDARHCKL